MTKNFYEVSAKLETLAELYNVLVRASNDYRQAYRATVKAGVSADIINTFGLPSPADKKLKLIPIKPSRNSTRSHSPDDDSDTASAASASQYSIY